MKAIAIKVVGKVENKSRSGILSKIIIEPEFSDCLDGLEKYSHIVVLYWMHKVKKNFNWGKRSFAHRTPNRPNPIGLTIVELISRDKNTITVKGLDAFDGSPIIDIKPYTGHPKDLILDFRSPDKF